MIASYPRYDSYKETSEEWIGKIPTTWDSVPLRNIFKFRNEKNDPIITDEILSLSIAHGVTKYSDKNRGGNKRKDDITAYKIARPNDIVLNSMNIIVGAVGLSKYFGAISPVYYALYLHSNEASINYYEWVFHNESFQKSLLKYGKGILIKMGEGGKMNTIRMKISQHDMKYFILPCPPLSDQEKIAKFLESKTAQIDQAITLKQQQIAKLEEYKQIVIQNAVTKGLNPDAPMKDSGVDWIGEIPKHWEVKKLKFISNVVLGKMICNEDRGGMQLKPYLKSKNIQWLNVDITSVDEMWFTEREMLVYRLKKDDLVLSEGGEVGKTCIWNNELDECYIQNSAHKVSFKSNHLPKYFLYQFFTLGKQGQFNKIVNRVSIGHLTKDKLINTDLITPTLEEQRLIVDYIEKTESIVLINIDVYKQQIDRLKEYKTILINQAVTGKIKVS